MQSIVIVFLSAAGLLAYGLGCDRIATHILAAAHMPLGPTWVVMGAAGAMLGVLLAISARFGQLPALTASNLVRPLLWLLFAMTSAAFVAGYDTRHALQVGAVRLPEPFASGIPVEGHIAFATAAAMHLAGYAVCGIGAGVMLCWAWRRRKAAVRFVLRRGFLRDAAA